jgi:CopG family transcriptional regulator, nickel-responsive regulator
MKSLTRFGVSIETDRVNRFDAFLESTGYRNRSEAFRDLIRARLIEEEIQKKNASVLGVLSIVYDHHKRELESKLTAIQHNHFANIITLTHVHVDHHNCLTVILLKGKAGDLQMLGASLAGLKGVKHSRLVFTSINQVTAAHEANQQGKYQGNKLTKALVQPMGAGQVRQCISTMYVCQDPTPSTPCSRSARTMSEIISPLTSSPGS